jgi:hypothetical protein
MKAKARGLWVLKLAVTAILVFGALGVTKPAAAYKECTPQEFQICNQFAGPRVACGSPTSPICFSNSCFGQCSGFSNCVAITGTGCAFPLN